MKIRVVIKAILSGVDGSVLKYLDFGNNYTIIKESLYSEKILLEFGMNPINAMRIYFDDYIDDKGNVALLYKEFEEECCYEIFTDSIVELNNYVDREFKYIDKTMQLIRLYSENSFNIKNVYYSIKEVVDDGSRDGAEFNSVYPFPDIIYGKVPKLIIKTKKDSLKLKKFLNDIRIQFENSIFSNDNKLLISIFSLYNQSYCSNLMELRLLSGVTALESALVNDNIEVSYKLRRNVSVLLCDNIEDYKEMFKETSNIYSKRSNFIHNANSKGITEELVVKTRDILRKVIFKILKYNLSKDELIQQLEIKGYIKRIYYHEKIV